VEAVRGPSPLVGTREGIAAPRVTDDQSVGQDFRQRAPRPRGDQLAVTRHATTAGQLGEQLEDRHPLDCAVPDDTRPRVIHRRTQPRLGDVPKPPVPADVAEFLTRPNYATISVVRPDGQPISYPTWYLFEDGPIVVNMDEAANGASISAETRVSTHYDGEPYGNRNRPRVTARVEIDRWHGWGRFRSR
jgi:hypothetical protein